MKDIIFYATIAFPYIGILGLMLRHRNLKEQIATLHESIREERGERWKLQARFWDIQKETREAFKLLGLKWHSREAAAQWIKEE